MTKQSLREVNEIVQKAVYEAAGGRNDGLVSPELTMMIAEKLYDETALEERVILLPKEHQAPLGKVILSEKPFRSSGISRRLKGRSPNS